MKETKKISVIIPIYNVKSYMNTCIASVYAQTYQNLEIILVDDGSTDGSGELCDEWEKKDSRIRVIHKENGGLSDARNAGMDIMTGEYVGFVDGDDWIEPTMYEKLLQACESTNSKVAACRFREITKKDQIMKWDPKHQRLESGQSRSKAAFSELYSIEDVMRAYIKESEEPRIYHCVWSKLYHKSIVENLRFEVGRKSEDIVFTTQVFCKIEQMAYLSEKLYDYNRIREDSIMNLKQESHTFEHEIPNWKMQFSCMEKSERLKPFINLARFYFYWRMISYAKEFRKHPETKQQAKRIEKMLLQEKELVKLACKEPEAEPNKVMRMKLFITSPASYWIADKIV